VEEDLHDTSGLIQCYKNSIPVKEYITILNLVEFPKAIELDLVAIYPSESDCEYPLKLSAELLRVGEPIPAIDAIIIATALNRR